MWKETNSSSLSLNSKFLGKDYDWPILCQQFSSSNPIHGVQVGVEFGLCYTNMTSGSSTMRMGQGSHVPGNGVLVSTSDTCPWSMLLTHLSVPGSTPNECLVHTCFWNEWANESILYRWCLMLFWNLLGNSLFNAFFFACWIGCSSRLMEIC